MSKLKNNETGFGAIETLLVIALIAVIAAVGVYVYQHKLQPPIKAVYNTQSHDMSLTYTSFSTRPVFTNNNTSQASDTTDLTYINGLINQAKIATAKLTTQYNVATLSSKQHAAMQQYISDSNAFLTDYQTLSTYTSQFDEVSSQFSFVTSLNSVTKGTNLATISTIIQTAASQLNTSIAAMKTLKPSPDMQQLNSAILSDFTTLDADLQALAVAINSHNDSQILVADSKVGQDANSIIALANTNLTGMLQHNSLIHHQIVTLESQNPLAN